MTEFEAALYFFTVMFAVTLFVGGYDWWLRWYDTRNERVHESLARRSSGRELLFDQERDQ